MLFALLKLIGLDLPAKIAAAKTKLELRFEEATDGVKQAVEHAWLTAVFSAIAIATAAMTAGVALIALYRWIGDAYGPYAGLGLTGAILIVVTAIFATAATLTLSTLTGKPRKLPRDPAGTADVTSRTHGDTSAPIAVLPNAQTAPKSDLGVPFSLLLTKFVKYPSVGNAVVDEVIGHLRASASDTAGEAIERAADVVRSGDLKNLVLVLTGAACAGWLLAQHSRQQRSS
jgi:hypothetical protein